MTELLTQAASILEESGFEFRYAEVPSDASTPIDALLFEDSTILGFVVVYNDVADLLARWKSDGDRLAMKHRSVLQAAQQKAWNAYLILLARQPATFAQALALGLIEEDLEAMRKIAQAKVDSPSAVRSALLPLLPFKAAPVLDPIDMPAEIAARTSELDEQIVKAFLSAADEPILLQLLEERA